MASDPPSQSEPGAGTPASHLKVVSMIDRGGLFDRVLAAPERISPAFHQIADLARGETAGYEVVFGFDDEAARSPRAWSRAVHLRQAGALEAELVKRALAVRERVPENRFLAVGVSAAAALSEELRAVFASAGRLDRFVLIVSDDAEPAQALDLGRSLVAVRDAGATIGVDETGSGYAALRQILRLRPEFVRIGGEFVVELDRDHAKAAVVEALGGLACRIDAWVIAAGVPGLPELDVLRRMGVPFAQGPLFGQARAEMDELVPSAAQAIKDAELAPAADRTVAGLIELRPSLPWGAALEDVADTFLEDPRHDVLVLVDERQRPLAIAERAALLRGEPYERPVTRVTPSSPLKTVARRAAARPLLERFHPLVVCDRRGVYLGIVRVENLLDVLAQ